MNKFLNEIEDIIEDMINGFVKLNINVHQSKNNNRSLFIKENLDRKVGLVTGGGSGHEPAFLGYLGKGLLDGVAVGEVFASPPAKTFVETIKEVNKEDGVLCLIGNYQGDVMNIKIAKQLAKREGIEVDFVVARDDIASAPKENYEQRHGLVGGILLWKIIGAKADQGYKREDLVQFAKEVSFKTRSICVGLSSCTIPAVGKPNFEIERGKMEVGVGHHGETGIEYADVESSKNIVKNSVQMLLDDFEFDGRKNLVLVISGLGATPLLEQYIVYNDVHNYLDGKHNIVKSYVGDYVTSLDMNGISITLMESNDEILELLETESNALGLNKI